MKIKKSEYTAQRNLFVQHMSEIAAALVALQELHDAGAALPEEIAGWNDLHDAEWQIEQDTFRIDQQWRCRNWTSQDYARYELVQQNVD